MIKRYKHIKQKRAAAVRAAIAGTKRKYKLVVHRSNKYIYAQMVKLATGQTLFGVKTKTASEAGKLMAQKAKTAKISEVAFDRGKNQYHGKVKLLAEAAREGGLKF